MVALAVVRMSVSPPNVCGAPLKTPVTRSNRLGVVRLPVLGSSLAVYDEASDAHIPHGVGRQRVRQMAEGDGRHRCVPALGRFERLHERRELGVDPELVVKALKQLQAWSQSPRELREDLVLLVGPRECRVGARLAVVVAQILVSRKEPQPIAHDRTAEVRREVAVPGALVPACRLAGAGIREQRPAGSSGRRSARSTTRRTETARFPAW